MRLRCEWPRSLHPGSRRLRQRFASRRSFVHLRRLRAVCHAYRSVARLSWILQPKPNLVCSTYERCGDPLSVTLTESPDLPEASQSFVTYTVYDSLSRCTVSSENVGNTNRYAYDSLGRCVRCV